MEAIFSIGGNLSDRAANLRQAKLYLAGMIGEIIDESELFESEPWGVSGPQKLYLNAVVICETEQMPEEIKQNIRRIEQKMGRSVSHGINEPRIIDIDLLFLDQLIYNTEDFQIPHRRLHLRKFVLLPLNEIRPKYLHPVFRKPVEALLRDCPDNTSVVKYQESDQSE
jgi:2-amino-4-hydroxy-6-hydroxymethyldihydropteridine diphosphokinase